MNCYYKALKLNVLVNVNQRFRYAQVLSRKLHTKHDEISTKPSFEIEKQRREFQNSVTTIIDSISNNQMYAELPGVKKWIQKIFRENLIGGKNKRGFTVVMAYGITENPEKVTEQSLQIARSVGWCVEMLQAHCTILDDIMDGSSIRRGKTCWHKRSEVGHDCAINDSILIYNNMFEVLKINLQHCQNYVDIIQTLTKTMCLTSAGQYLDLIMTKYPKVYDTFTFDTYNSIVKYKTAFYTYNLPVNLGLLLSSTVERKMYKPVNDICIKLGQLFQMQDDYIDCYGDEAVTGKAGTDIQEGKCTWLAVSALLNCNEKQKKVFTTCYGSPEPAHIDRIKRLYEDLQIPKLYKTEEQQLYEDILQNTNSLSNDSIRYLLKTLLKTTYKRQF